MASCSQEVPGTSYMSLPPDCKYVARITSKVKGLIYGLIAAENYANARCGERPGRKQLTWGYGAQQTLLVLDGLIRNGGLVVATDFATRLRYWARFGFPELPPSAAIGLSPAIQTNVRVHEAIPTSNQFVDYPEETAKKIWDLTGKREALNSCVARTGCVGAVQFWNLEQVQQNAATLCKATHADPRCVVACVAVSSAVALILQGKSDMKEVTDEAFTLGGNHLGGDEPALKEFGIYAGVTKLRDLHLGDPQAASYSYKAMGAAFAVLRSAPSFEAGINAIVDERGDPENAAVAGALLGVRFGLQNIPEEWLSQLSDKKLIDKRVGRFVDAMGLSEMSQYIV